MIAREFAKIGFVSGGDRVKRVALETIESEIPDVDYGCDYEKDVALAFMHRVGGIVTLANRLAEECADG